MRFAEIPKAFAVAAVASDALDFGLTLFGYYRFSPLLEANPYVLFLTQFVDPYVSITAVFSASLVLVVISYRFVVRAAVEVVPYGGTLTDVGRYLVGSGSVRRRDLALFAVLVMYGLLVHMHMLAAVRWMQLLRGAGAFVLAPMFAGWA